MKRFVLSCLTVLSLTAAQAQGDLDALLKGSQADANYLAQGYMEPVLNAIGSGLNQGWYNTAATHKKLGFDLTLSVSSIQFPSEDSFYKVDNTRLNTLKLVSPTDGNVPTFVGPETTPTYRYKDPTTGLEIPGSDFQGPPGVGLSEIPLGGLPVPTLNLGIGIPWNTDVKLRYGTLSQAEAKVNLFGFAIQHDIKQHIPGLKELPFDLSALFGYTSFNTEIAFDPTGNPDQLGKADFTATTIQAIVGKKISVLTLYGSLGYNFSSGTFKASGVYDTGAPPPAAATMTDPVSISSSVNGPRATAGLRLKLAVFTFHGDYTFQRYNTLTVGFGIAVR
jgi:hypothetical protein